MWGFGPQCLQLLNSGAVPDGKIMHLNGGIYAWDSEGKDVDGEYDGANAGRTPAAAAPAQFPAQQK